LQANAAELAPGNQLITAAFIHHVDAGVIGGDKPICCSRVAGGFAARPFSPPQLQMPVAREGGEAVDRAATFEDYAAASCVELVTVQVRSR
jgi:hypothetical protein